MWMNRKPANIPWLRRRKQQRYRYKTAFIKYKKLRNVIAFMRDFYICCCPLSAVSSVAEKIWVIPTRFCIVLVLSSLLSVAQVWNPWMASISTALDIAGTGESVLIAECLKKHGCCQWLSSANTCKYDSDCSLRLRENSRGQYVSSRLLIRLLITVWSPRHLFDGGLVGAASNNFANL